MEDWARSQAPVFSFIDVRACAVPGCPRSQDANAMCAAHQRQWRSAGRPPLGRFQAWAEPAALTGRPCIFPGREFPATPRSELCDGHRVKFRRYRHHRGGERTLPDFVAHVEAQRGNDTARFDLSGLPETLALELQFTLQCRHDEAGATFPPGRWASVVEVLRAHRVESLLGHEPGFWRELDPTWKPGNRRLGYIRYALKVLRRLEASALGLDPWEPDLWDVRGLPIGDSYRHQRVSWIDWRGVEPGWLRALAKRWARQRLSTDSRSPATIHSAAKELRHFSRFLENEGVSMPRPEALTRRLLERYRTWVLALDISVSYQRLLLGTLNTLLEETRRLEWAGIPASACYLPGELPRVRDSLPRAIDGPVMAQLESDQALARIESPTVRTAITILIETGLRAVDVCRLAFHPLLSGADGAPYLGYFNHKLKREAVIPVSDRLVATVARQQEYVERTWPQASDWLLPRPRSNPNAEHPLGYSMLHKAIGRWLGALELRDPGGRKVTVTAHQFRHTLATRMINDGVPLEAIRRYLDHNSETMTLRYARLHDTELRRHWETWQRHRGNIHGEVLPAEHEQLLDAAWTKETLARARQALPNGYCGLPLQQTCPHPNARLGCDSFLTDASHLDTHRAHLDRVERMIAQADERGWDRVADNNRRDRDSLINIIQALEKDDDPAGQPPAPGASDG